MRYNAGVISQAVKLRDLQQCWLRCREISLARPSLSRAETREWANFACIIYHKKMILSFEWANIANIVFYVSTFRSVCISTERLSIGRVWIFDLRI